MKADYESTQIIEMKEYAAMSRTGLRAATTVKKRKLQKS